MNLDTLRERCKPHVRAALTRSSIVSADIQQVDTEDGLKYSVSTTTGVVAPDEDTVSQFADMLARVLVDVLPSLEIDVTVKVDPASGEGSGVGSIK